MVNLSVHNVTRIEVRHITGHNGTIWRGVVLHTNGGDSGGRNNICITAFPVDDNPACIALPGDDPDVVTAMAALLDAMAPDRAVE